MGKLILIRHGNTPPPKEVLNPSIPLFQQPDKVHDMFYSTREGLPEIPLTQQRGIREAYATGEHLSSNYDVTRIDSSTALRAAHTATIISKVLGLSFSSEQQHPEITERMNFGDDMKQTWDGFDEEWQRTSAERTYKPVDPYVGDSVDESAAKMRDFLLGLPEQEGDIAVVSHGGKIRDFANTLIEEGTKAGDLSIRQPDEEGREQKGLANCSIAVVRREGNGFFLESINGVKHLEGLNQSPEGGFRGGRKE